MEYVLASGTGHVGALLRRTLRAAGHQVTVLSRRAGADAVHWDGRTLGPWTDCLDGADVVINLAGRSVSCRYTEENLTEMMRSRVDSARVVGEANGLVGRPPA